MKTRFFSLPESLETRIAPAAIVEVDLGAVDGTNGFRLSGVAQYDRAGYSVSDAGDVNGDGFGDVIVGALRADPNGSASGSAYVVFGKDTGFSTPFELSSLNGTNGFRLDGAVTLDYAGNSVSAAGDVNGDGFDDIIVGAKYAETPNFNSGAAYVILGKATPFAATVALSALNGIDGFKLSGVTFEDDAGWSVANAGDVNGDSFDDVIVGARFNDFGGTNRGRAYVVYGRGIQFPANLDLPSLASGDGFIINGVANDDQAGYAVSGAGDLNGDGFDDVVVGATGSDPNGAISGTAYVIFGKGTPFSGPVSLGSLTAADGFKLHGEFSGDAAGNAVSAAGDVNNDGVDDLLIGATSANPNGTDTGAAYVFFGQASGLGVTVELSALNGTNGFRINGVNTVDRAGVSVGAAGDVNGDGIDDVIVGAHLADPNGSDSGASYVVFGKTGVFAATFDLSTLDGLNGFKISGAAGGDWAGGAVSAAGDVNGDGFDDVIIGARYADPNGTNSGAAYVVFGAAVSSVPDDLVVEGKTITFTEPDGDEITIKLSVSGLTADDLTFTSDGTLGVLDLSGLAAEAHAGGAKAVNLNIGTLQSGGGDGKIKLGLLKATDLNLGKVKLTGDLGGLQMGTGIGKSALKALTITGNLGGNATVMSEVLGNLGKMKVTGDVLDAVFNVTGNAKSLTIGGNFNGAGALPLDVAEAIAAGGVVAPGGAMSGLLSFGGKLGKLKLNGNLDRGSFVVGGDVGSVTIVGGLDAGLFFAGGKLKTMKIGGRLGSDTAAEPGIVTARNRLDFLQVSGDVENGRILVGYNKDADPVNSDVTVGKVIVKGDWIASSLAAGIDDSTADGFGRNDTLIAGDATPTVFAKIASITIKGMATGSSSSMSDHFGITAQKIGKVSIGGSKVPLDKSAPDDVLLDEANGDFRLVEL